METYPYTLSPLFFSRYQGESPSVVLPLNDSARAASDAPGQCALCPAQERSDADGRVILIVSPDPRVLDTYTRLLPSVGPQYQIRPALSQQLARDLLQRVRPALVVLDLEPGTLDGCGLLETMWGDAELRSIPVIVLTTQALALREQLPLPDTGVTVLIKGLFTVDETLGRIKQALAGTRKLHCTTRRIVYEVVAEIHAHYGEPLTRDSLATIASVSTRHLTRCFNTELGMAPMAFLNRYRIFTAMRLLRTSGRSKSIAEVGRSVGFASSAYFDAVFHRETGLAPSAYRHCYERRDDGQA